MKGMFKRALAGVAAAALAVTGFALGAGAANAAGTVVHNPAVTYTFTGDADQLADAEMHAYKIADYVQYGTNPTVYGVQTADDVTRDQIDAALTAAGVQNVPAEGDLMAWVLGQDPALLNIDGADWGYENGAATSETRLFANALAEAGLSEVANAKFVTGDEQITVDLEPGVYLFTNTRVDGTGKVSATVPMLLASGTLDEKNKVLTSVEGGNIKVEMKNSANTPQTKEVTEKSASIGDTLHYTLKGQVTSTVADTFSFEDTPGVGLTVNLPTDAENLNGFSVAVYDVDEEGNPTGEPTPLTYDADYTITNNLREGNMGGEVSDGVMGTFTVTVKDAYRYAGEMIVVEYTALVNDEASVEDGVVNTLDNYGNSMQTETKMHSFDFTKKNVDGEALPEAQFEISKGEETLYFVKQADGSYKKAVSKETPGATSTLEVIKEGADKGKLVVTGLGEGNYTVHETKAPTGYQLPTNLTFTVTIAADGAVTIVQDAFKLASQDSQTKAITVTNVRNITELPLTGAAGTMLFTVLGLLIAGAGALVYMKSRSVKHALRG